MNVLIVDDDSAVTDTICFAFNRAGYSITPHSTTSVRAATELLPQLFKPTPVPSLPSGIAIIDMHLPDLQVDGYYLIGYIQDHIAQNRIVPIPTVAISADMNEVRRKRCEAVGASMIVEKPLTTAHIHMMYELASQATTLTHPYPVNPIWELTAEVVTLLSDRIKPSITAHQWSHQEVYGMLTLLAPALRFSRASDKRRAEQHLQRLGGATMVRFHLEQCRAVILHSDHPHKNELVKILDYLLNGVSQHVILQLRNIGRSRFQRRVKQLCQLISDYLNQYQVSL